MPTRRRSQAAVQLSLNGKAKVKDARFAPHPELEAWKERAETQALTRWQELDRSRRPCTHQGCKAVAVIWILSWSTAAENTTFCKEHWPIGEGEAMESSQGWLPDGQALAELGWLPRGRWVPPGGEKRRIRRSNFDFGEVSE